MKRILLVMFTLLPGCFVTKAPAQFTFPTMGSRGAALGGCSVALTDAWSASTNIAGLAFQDRSTVGLSIQQNSMMDGLNYGSLLALLHTPSKGTFALTLDHFGSSIYHEQRAALSYAVLIASKQSKHPISLGAQLLYLHSATEDSYYLPVNLITFAIGAQIILSQRSIFGARIYNPIDYSPDATVAIQIPSMLNIGVCYRFADELLGTLEVEKDLYRSPRLRTGLEYCWNNMFLARIGLSTGATTFTYGLGYLQKHFAIDLAMQHHQVLGLTPQLSAYYHF